MNLVENADLVRQQVETARNKANRQDQVNVIAVTKYVDVATTEALVKTGIQHIGENRRLLSCLGFGEASSRNSKASRTPNQVFPPSEHFW